MRFAAVLLGDKGLHENCVYSMLDDLLLVEATSRLRSQYLLVFIYFRLSYMSTMLKPLIY